MFILLALILQLRHALAILPHEVVNITSVASEPVTITEYSVSLSTITATESCPAPTTESTIYGLVFPSPDATPVVITAQSQVVTSYLPEMTWCIGPPLVLQPMQSAPLYPNGTSNANYTTVLSGSASCSTSYAPLTTTVCTTTLTGLASKVRITDCNQEVTFSTECGFTIETPTPVITAAANLSLITPAPGPIVRRMYTYWLAPWQSLTAGEAPSDVDVKICTELDDYSLECIRYQEIWEIVVVTQTLATPRTIEFSTTITGPGTLIVETLHTTVADTVTSIDLSTVLLLRTETEVESIRTGRRPRPPLPTVSSTQEVVSTVYITKNLLHRPTSTSAAGNYTSTFRVTSFTTEVRTITLTRPRPIPSLVQLEPQDFAQ